MTKIESRPLFNPQGDDNTAKRTIIKGQSTGLFNLNDVKYAWATQMYRVMIGNFWVPEKVSGLGEDAIQYKNLTEAEKKAYDGVLSFLIFLDSLQTVNLPHFSDYITAPEINLLLSIQSYQESIHCFKDGTEILTNTGFKDFNTLTKDDLVANYNEDRTITFSKPKEIIKQHYKGDMYNFSGQRYESTVTPNHRIVKNNSYNNNELKIERADSVSVNCHTIPVAGKGVGKKTVLTPTDRLYIAYQADGYLCNSDSVRSTDYTMYRFYFNKERKVNRLIAICEEGGFRYTKKENKTTGGYNIYVWHKDIFDKEFNKIDVSKISSEYGKSFIDELTYWDGCRAGTVHRYTNSNKEAINKVIAICAVSNIRAGIYIVKNGVHRMLNNKVITQKKDSYCITFNHIDYVSGRSVKKKKIDYDGIVHCVTVDSGMVIVKDNFKVTVSGNSQSYATILEAVVDAQKRDEIYYFFRNDSVLLERNEYIGKLYQDFIDNPTDENFFQGIIANYLLEGLYFYNGFAFFDTLVYAQKMTATGRMISYIRRDELTHVTLFANVIKTIEREFPEMYNREMIIEMTKVAVEQEIKWTNHIIGDGVSGITKEATELYTKWLANQRLQLLGIEALYPEVTKNPYKHLEMMADNNSEKTNFFESTVVNYTQSSSMNGSWDF